MKARTYDDWKLLGYHVIKGERATGRDARGVATFTRDQVEEDFDIGSFRFSDAEDP